VSDPTDQPTDLPTDPPTDQLGDAPASMTPDQQRRAATLRAYLQANDLEHTETAVGGFSFALPGERKLQTPVRLDVGVHALGVHAFVCRQPDEAHERVYRWLLERNLKTFGAAFALDHHGDIYLDGRLPLGVLDAVQGADGPADPTDLPELDRLLGAVLSTADESFNAILELGFASSIRKEWDWRRLRGESTANLEAFRGWLEAGDDARP
jgi:hypothetical protein